MLIDVVADHHIHGLLRQGLNPKLPQDLSQGLLLQPVVGIHHLVVESRGVAQPLVDPLSVAAVGLMNGPDHRGIFRGVSVADGGGIVLGGAVVNEDDLHLLSPGQERVDAFFHIGRAVVAGHRKG